MTETTPFRPAHELLSQRPGLAALEPGKKYAKVRAVIKRLETPPFKSGKNQGKTYLAVLLGDRTGELEAKSWEGASLASTLSVGDVVELSGVEVDEYDGRVGMKFAPQDLRVLPPGEYEASEFVPTLPAEQMEQNWLQLQGFLDSLTNPHLLRLREAVFADPEVAQRYKAHPSAVWHHHNYLGGNVQHVVGMMRVIDAVSTSYPELDRDVVVFGAAVHDLGKLREYAVDTTIRVTDEGRLKGHIVIGAEWLGRIIAQLRGGGYEFPRGLEDHLVHMVLAHHGRADWGSPKPPATPEAMLLHLADMADSQTRGLLQEVERNQGNAEGWVRRNDPDFGGSRWIWTRRDYD